MKSSCSAPGAGHVAPVVVLPGPFHPLGAVRAHQDHAGEVARVARVVVLEAPGRAVRAPDFDEVEADSRSRPRCGRAPFRCCPPRIPGSGADDRCRSAGDAPAVRRVAGRGTAPVGRRGRLTSLRRPLRVGRHLGVARSVRRRGPVARRIEGGDRAVQAAQLPAARHLGGTCAPRRWARRPHRHRRRRRPCTCGKWRSGSRTRPRLGWLPGTMRSA